MTLSVRTLSSLLVAALLVTSGCLGVLTGAEPLEVEAAPVAVSSAAQADAGYEEVRREAVPLSREFSAGGESREVQVTNYLAEYSRSISIGPIGTGEFGRFVVLSTPAVEVLGRTFNPVGDMSNRDLAEEVQSQYDGLDNLQPAGERQATVLGTGTTVSTFTADGRIEGTGQSVELLIHIAKVRHEDDFVVIVAVHPSLVPGEADRVDAMLTGIRHGP